MGTKSEEVVFMGLWCIQKLLGWFMGVCYHVLEARDAGPAQVIKKKIYCFWFPHNIVKYNGMREIL